MRGGCTCYEAGSSISNDEALSHVRLATVSLQATGKFRAAHFVPSCFRMSPPPTLLLTAAAAA